MPSPVRPSLALFALLAATIAGAQAQPSSRRETLRYAAPGVVNTLDPAMLGATPEATALSTAIYDRLLRFGRKPAGDGTFVVDFARLEGELAESYAVSPDGRRIILHLRPGATWQDGTPVTAEDVKWSLDRAVSAGSMGKAQMATGSLVRPDQFAVVDAQTVAITLDAPDPLALPNLATSYAPMVNATLAKRHATPEDPWAATWMKAHTAAGGAYRVERFEPGREVVLVRDEAWDNGAKPAFPRLIVQTVPEATTRAALVERGDADLTIGLTGEDLKSLRARGSATVVSTPMPTGFVALVFNTRVPPFDRVEVRRALASALPYEDIFTAALDGHGERLYGARWTDEPPTAGFPQALPLKTDLAAAKRLLAEAGYPEGFETSLSYSASRAFFAEPAAALIQEAFAKLGVRVRIDKLADAPMATAVTEKRLPMLVERSFAIFPATDYFFRVFMNGPSRWNFSSWNDPDIGRLLAAARHESDTTRADALARRLVGLAAAEVPMAFIAKPSYDVVLAKGITGFTTWSNYYPDLRDLRRE